MNPGVRVQPKHNAAIFT